MLCDPHPGIHVDWRQREQHFLHHRRKCLQGSTDMRDNRQYHRPFDSHAHGLLSSHSMFSSWVGNLPRTTYTVETIHKFTPVIQLSILPHDSD